MTKRAYGTGALFEKHGAWYGALAHARRPAPSRRVGPVRAPGTDLRLTRRETEAQLPRLMLLEETQPTPLAAGRHTVNESAEALRQKKRVQGVGKSYVRTIESA